MFSGALLGAPVFVSISNLITFAIMKSREIYILFNVKPFSGIAMFGVSRFWDMDIRC